MIKTHQKKSQKADSKGGGGAYGQPGFPSYQGEEICSVFEHPVIQAKILTVGRFHLNLKAVWEECMLLIPIGCVLQENHAAIVYISGP